MNYRDDRIFEDYNTLEEALKSIAQFREGQDAKLCAIIAKSALKEIEEKYNVNSSKKASS